MGEIGTPLWWCVQFALNFLDFVMVYLVAHALTRRLITIKLPHVLFCVSYTLAMAPVFYYLGGHIYTLLSSIFMLLVIKMIAKGRRLSDLVIMLSVSFAIIFVTQLPIVSLTWIFAA